MTATASCRGLAPERTCLSNGVVMLAYGSDAVPAVALNATFLAGSAQDPAGLPGVAYLTRRTIDRGTEMLSADDIAAAIDDRGVALRTSVTRHGFTLSCVCLPEDFEDILRIVADIARHPVFPRAELEQQRVEAITSIHEDADDPARVASDLLGELLYGPVHPYGRRVKGGVASLESITRAHLTEFHRCHLVPSALRLAIAGHVSAPDALAAAEKVFEDWSGLSAVREPVPPPASRSTRAVTTREMPGKAQSDIAYGFPAVRRADSRYYAYWVMNNILGQFGLGGRLAENIRERQGMAYYAYSTLEPAEGEAALVVQAGVDPANVERAIEAIDTEVGRLGASGPTFEELEETRESLIGSIPRMLETNEGIAEFLIQVEQFGLGLDYDRRLPGLLRRVTMDDVRQAAADVLVPSRAAIAVAGPRP